MSSVHEKAGLLKLLLCLVFLVFGLLKQVRGQPFNSWGGVGDLEKNISCKCLLEENNCMQHKWNRKKILARAARKKTKKQQQQKK